MVRSPHVSKLSVVDLSEKKKRRILSTSTRDWLCVCVCFFYPRSIVNPVMKCQRSNVREIDNFPTSQVNAPKIINNNERKLLSACFPFISGQNDGLFWYLD